MSDSEGKESEQWSIGFELAELARAEEAVQAVKVPSNTCHAEQARLRSASIQKQQWDGAGLVSITKRSNFKATTESELLVRTVAFKATTAKVQQTLFLIWSIESGEVAPKAR